VGNVRGARPQAATAHTASSKTVPSLPVGPMLRKHCYAKSCRRPWVCTGRTIDLSAQRPLSALLRLQSLSCTQAARIPRGAR
jgi:hypothetical protein